MPQQRSAGYSEGALAHVLQPQRWLGTLQLIQSSLHTALHHVVSECAYIVKHSCSGGMGGTGELMPLPSCSGAPPWQREPKP